MTTRTQYQREFALWTEFSRAHLVATGSLSPMWQVTAGGTRYVLVTPWATQDEKEMAVAFIRAVMASVNAESWMFTCEAWSAAYAKHDPGLAELRPSKRNDRRESLLVQAGHREHQRLEMMQTFGRDANGGVVLETPMAPMDATSSWMFDHLFEWDDLSQEARDAAGAILVGESMGRPN